MLRNFGYDVVRYPGLSEALSRRKRFFERAQIDLVLDVGANEGQFATELREQIRYTKRIVSFEPLPGAFRVLQELSRADPDWEAFECALGETTETRTINIAGNSWSSSLLDMLPNHIDAAPGSRYVATQQIEIRTLDSLFKDLRRNSQNCYLKIDTQGFERHVIAGAAESLRFIELVQMEMSFSPLYEGELPFDKMISLMRSHGFILVTLEPGFTHERTDQLLQVDGIFRREKA